MALTRYSSGNYVPVTFSSLLNGLLTETLNDGKSAYTFLPDVDVIESEKHFEIHVAAPGMKKEDFKIELAEGKLVISGERKFVKENNGSTYRSVETKFGSFTRSFQLPENVNTQNIEASYKDGILQLIVPKDEKKVLSKNIEVK